MTTERTAAGRQHANHDHPKKHDCEDRDDRDREVTIVVNGRPKVVPKKKLTFEELVTLAFPDADPNPNIIYTITFKRGNGNKPQGTLVPGESVKIKEGMVFNVTATDKS